MAVGQCRSCGNSFAGVVAFDEHWKGKDVDERPQRCQNPRALPQLQLDRRGRWQVTPNTAR